MTRSEIRLRPMRPEDIPQVHAIDRLSFSLPWPERSYRFEVNENSHASCWVAEMPVEQGGWRIVAMMVTWVIIDEAHIATIAVHPDFRRLGIGKLILAKGLLAAKERGALLAFLEVRQGNLAAQAMYASFGFEVTGTRPHYYQDNHEDAVLMTLEHLDPDRLRELGGLAEVLDI